jgi:dihydrodipicolinate synthase/N-acetylneuraminate lyase
MSKKIEGLLPIIHMPFLENDEIDSESLKRQIDWVYSFPCNGFGLAMASELLRLTKDERVDITYQLAELNQNRGAVIISVGAESTKEALFYGSHAERAGCDALMAIPPISSALPESALEEYFCSLADEINLPLIIQDASGYVGRPISLGLSEKLLNKYGPDKILFKPEAAPLGPNISKLRDATQGRAKIFEGSGGISLVDSYRRKITGTMPGCDLLEGTAALWEALEKGDEDRIYKLYFPICAITTIESQAGLDGFMAIEKYILKNKGIFNTARRRRPYAWEMDKETEQEIDRLLLLLQKAL